MIVAIHGFREFMMQHIGIFVQAQLVRNFTRCIQLVVFGNFVTILTKDFQAETFLCVTVIDFTMLQL